MSQPAATERPVIYQTLVRLFGNTNETRKPDGTLAENGCGKFADFTDTALAALKDFGATHLWLTGVLEQASETAYPGRPADPPELLKGRAGSPYAIRDYFDVCPDYAVEPERRREEFRELLARCARHGLRCFIDFVPNHVARSYESDVRPDLNFGPGDDVTVFFGRDNHFYYVQPWQGAGAPPLRLPEPAGQGTGGTYTGEREFVRVTGNNAITCTPSANDWYETVKLNYGHDFTTGRDTRHLPAADTDPAAVPDTWRKMDAVLAYWQEYGVGGFRVDMAHLIPLEFWRWSIRRARARDPQAYFFAEAYDTDPAKLCDGNVLAALLEAGFDAVYDDPAYDLCMGLYDDFKGYKWANDLAALQPDGPFFHRSLRYAENHDEVRLASPLEWSGLGARVGRPVSATLFLLGRGPVMVYSGQEVGEPALGAAGFSVDDGRTTIFDYWSMPEFTKWVAGGKYDGSRMSAAARELRAWYRRLLQLVKEPAFSRGDFYGLNHANAANPAFGRLAGEEVSGHWLYAYLRRDSTSGQAFLVVANFHGSEDLHGLRIQLPADAQRWLGWPEDGGLRSFEDRLEGHWQATVAQGLLASEGLPISRLPACSALVVALT